MQQMSYGAAVNAALTDEMAADDSVFVFGLDVPDHKRIYGSTEGLVERFGPDTGDAVRLLYGGSVKPGNAREIFAVSNVDGGLVGGASLKAADFSAIVAAAG